MIEKLRKGLQEAGYDQNAMDQDKRQDIIAQNMGNCEGLTANDVIDLMDELNLDDRIYAYRIAKEKGVTFSAAQIDLCKRRIPKGYHSEMGDGGESAQPAEAQGAPEPQTVDPKALPATPDFTAIYDEAGFSSWLNANIDKFETREQAQALFDYIAQNAGKGMRAVYLADMVGRGFNVDITKAGLDNVELETVRAAMQQEEDEPEVQVTPEHVQPPEVEPEPVKPAKAQVTPEPGQPAEAQGAPEPQTVDPTALPAVPDFTIIYDEAGFSNWLNANAEKFKTPEQAQDLYNYIVQTVDPNIRAVYLADIVGREFDVVITQPGLNNDELSIIKKAKPQEEPAQLNGEETAGTLNDLKTFFAQPQDPASIIGTIRRNPKTDYYDLLPTYTGDGELNGQKYLFVGKHAAQPIFFWEVIASSTLKDGKPLASVEERNKQIKYLLGKGSRINQAAFDKLCEYVVDGNETNNRAPTQNYTGLLIVCRHILEDKDKSYSGDFRKHVLEKLAEAYEKTGKNRELLLPRELAAKLAKEFPEIAVDYLAACQPEPEVEEVKVEDLARKPGESFKDWMARTKIARHHQSKAGDDPNSPHKKIGDCYVKLTQLYDQLANAKTPAERKKILTEISLVLGSTDKNGIRSKALNASLSTAEQTAITAEHNRVQKELIALNKKRDIKKTDKVVGPGQGNPPSNGQETPEERERKRKAAIDAAAAARHDPDQQKATWWEKNQEWIWWLIGILVVATLGVLAFRKGGWFNKDKKKATVSTGNTNTNTNTNTGNDNNNSNTGGLAGNAEVYSAEDVCNALALNSRTPPVLSSTRGNNNNGGR